jgi:hypothetical protein
MPDPSQSCATGTSLMPEIAADLPNPSHYPLFFGSRIQESQVLAPDPSLPRTREERSIARTCEDSGFLPVRARQPAALA